MTCEPLSCVCAIREHPSMKDFPGRMSCLMYAPLCNMRCPYCHNSQLLEPRRCFTLSELETKALEMRRKWIGGVSLSGGEVTLHEELPATLRLLKSLGMHVKIDTNLSNPAMLEKCLPYLDYIAFDVKCPLDEYESFCRFPRRLHYAILESLSIVSSSPVPHEARVTVLPDYHTPERLDRMLPLLSKCRTVYLQPFVPHDDLPEVSLRALPRCPESHLRTLQERLLAQGINALVR